MVNDIQDFIITFTSILWEAMPFIVLGAVIAGVLEEFMPQQLIGRIIPAISAMRLKIVTALGRT